MDNKRSSLVDRIPFWHFDGDLAVYSDGSLGAGFSLEGVDISCASNDFINEVTTQLETLLKSTSDGLKLQVFYRLTPNVSSLIDSHRELSNSAHPKFKVVSSARLNHFEQRASSQGYFLPEIYFFVRSRPHTFKKKGLFEASAKFATLTASEYEAHKERFVRDVKNLESSLAHAKLTPQGLSKDQWFSLLFEYFNLGRSQKLDAPKLRDELNPFTPSLASQFILTDVFDGKEHIKIGNYFFRAITLGVLPEGSTYAAMVDSFTKVSFHFWLTQNIEILDQKVELEKLQLSRRLASSMARGAKNVSDLENESKLENLEEIISELMEGSEKIVKTDFNVIIWAQGLEELEEKSDEILKSFSSMGQSEGIVETLPGLDIFLGSMPGPCAGLRFKKVKTSNCAHFMPVYNYWRGNSKPICLLPNRDGSLFSLDPFDKKDLQNFNALIFGGSGAGKSFTILQLAMMLACGNYKIIWIDNGASSRRLLDESVFDGQFIDLHLESQIRLNLFDLPKGEKLPGPSKIKLLLATIEIMLRDDEKTGLPKLHKAQLEECIYLTYERCQGNTPILGDLKTVLEGHESAEMRNYARVLYSWTGDRPFGRLIDGTTNIDLSKDLVTIEIKGLDSYPELQSVMLLNFTDFIKTVANQDTSRRTLLIIDEAWRLFTNDSGSAGSGRSFSIEAYRTFRKFGGGAGIWCISQNYRDFLADEELANALLPNTASIFVLKQVGIDWNDLKERLQLNEAELEIVKKLTIKKGEYSELFYMQGERRTVLRIAPDPLSYWIATSDANDNLEIDKMKERFPNDSIMQILTKLVDQNEQAHTIT